MFLAVITLSRRELSRFMRERTRIIGALGTPVVFWLLIGSGFGASFHPSGGVEGVHYLEYFFPGTILLILLFTSIFSTISIIEDRHEGFLQAVLVAPIRRLSIVLGKVIGGATIAVVQAMVFLLVAPLLGISFTLWRIPALMGILFLLAFALTSLGFLIAWRIDSTQGYHAVMTLILIPMWLLSGALFPSGGAAVWLQWVIVLNPLAYGLGALRRCLYIKQPLMAGDTPSLTICVFVLLLFALVSLLAAHRQVCRQQ